MLSDSLGITLRYIHESWVLSIKIGQPTTTWNNKAANTLKYNKTTINPTTSSMTLVLPTHPKLDRTGVVLRIPGLRGK